MDENASKVDLLEVVEAPVASREIPEFRAGDTVKVHVRVVEGEKVIVFVWIPLLWPKPGVWTRGV